jgi:hypothetical protein
MAPLVGDRPGDAPPLVLSPARLATAPGGTPRQDGDAVALARGALVHALFRAAVIGVHLGDPFTDALAALAADGGRQRTVDLVRGLGTGERAALAAEVAEHAEVMRRCWPTLAPSWLPRTGERVSIPLAGGRVVLSGIFDLAVGVPPSGRSSVCVVDLRTGDPHARDVLVLHYLGLLETLRSGAAPFRVATFYSRYGLVEAAELGDDDLAASVERTVATVAEQLTADRAAPLDGRP